MKTVTALELQTLDARQFEREYYEWNRYACDDSDWYEFIEEDFKERCVPLGIKVENITFSLSYSQGDGAAFTGSIELAALMKHLKLDETYLALYLAVEEAGSWVNVEPSRCYGVNTKDYDTYDVGESSPAGVFSDLPQDAWRELVNAQEAEVDLEEVAREFCEGLAHDLYISLRNEYEYQTSEEMFIESCEANEVTFEIETEEEDV